MTAPNSAILSLYNLFSKFPNDLIELQPNVYRVAGRKLVGYCCWCSIEKLKIRHVAPPRLVHDGESSGLHT